MKLKNTRKQQQQQFPWIYSNIKAFPNIKIIIFPILQRNPINNFTVKGPDEQWMTVGPRAATMVEVATAPNPPQGHLQFCLFQMWLIGVSKLLYGTVPSRKACQGVKPKSSPRSVQSQGFCTTPLSSSKGPAMAEAWLQAASDLAAWAQQVFCTHHSGKSSGGLSP